MASKFKRYAAGVFLCLSVSLLINTRALAQDKKTSYALSHYIMGVMYDDLGQIEKSIEEYKRALKADPQNSIIHLNLALGCVKKGDFPEAIKELNLVAKLEPEAVEPHAVLALLYATQNQEKLATEEYELALKNASKLQPKNIEIYKTLGAVYLQQKKFPAAESIYRLIIGLSPQDAEAHFYLGNIYWETSRKGAAIQELKKAVELKPDYHEALNYLGYIYVEEGRNLDEAEMMIKKALELEPDNGAYVDSLGWLYFKRGKVEEALKELERAGILMADPVIFDHLGDAYLKIGEKEKAESNWKKSLELDPNQDKVKAKLK